MCIAEVNRVLINSFVYLSFWPCFFLLYRVFVEISTATGSKVAKAKGRKVCSGVHEAVLSFIKEMAVFKELA